MLQYAKNDRLDSIKLGHGGPYSTDYTSVSAGTFIPKDIMKPTENSETMKLKITHDHTHYDPSTDRNQTMQTTNVVYDKNTSKSAHFANRG